MGKSSVSFQFSPSEEIKLKRPGHVDEDLNVQVPKNNYLARLVAKPGFEEIINFFKNHNISQALTLSPGHVYPQLLCEFWYTVSHSLVDGVSVLTGYIENGTTTITITADIIRRVLGFQALEAYDPLPASDDSKEGIIDLTKINVNVTVGADGSKRFGTIHKKNMDGVWNVFFGTIIQCLGTKQGSFDQLNTLEAQLSWSLINNLKVDYASVIFNELVTRVTAPTRSEYVPYSRFISLVIKDQFPAYDQLPFQGMPPSVVGAHIFHKPATVTLPPQMKQILNPTPLASLPLSPKSLITPPVTHQGAPSKKTPTAPTKKSKLGSLTLKDQGHRKRKSSKDAKVESVAERLATEGQLDKPVLATTSLDSRKSSDFTRGPLQTAAETQISARSVQDVSPILPSSQTLTHLASTRMDVTSPKGLVSSADVNTSIAGGTVPAKDPSHLLSPSSITAQAANVSLPKPSEIQVYPSVSHDPSVKTQTGDDEEATPMDISASGADLAMPEGADDSPTSQANPEPIHSAESSQKSLSDPLDAEVQSPIRELDISSFSSDEHSAVNGEGQQPDQSLALGDQADQLVGQPAITSPEQKIIEQRSTSPPKPVHSSPPSDENKAFHHSPQREESSSSFAGTQRLLMEYISSSKKEVEILKETRDKAHAFISDISAAVISHGKIYNDLLPWSTELTNKTKEIALRTDIHTELHNKYVPEFESLAAMKKETLAAVTAQNAAIAVQQDTISKIRESQVAVTKAQEGLQTTMVTFIEATSSVIDELPAVLQMGQETTAHQLKLIFEKAKEMEIMKKQLASQQITLSEVAALKQEIHSIKQMLIKPTVSTGTQTDAAEPDFPEPAAEESPLPTDDAKKGEKTQLEVIVEVPEEEERALVEVADVEEEAVVEQVAEERNVYVFPVMSEALIKRNEALVKQWALDAQIQGELDNVTDFPVVSYEQSRWDWVVAETERAEKEQALVVEAGRQLSLIDEEVSEGSMGKELVIVEEGKIVGVAGDEMESALPEGELVGDEDDEDETLISSILTRKRKAPASLVAETKDSQQPETSGSPETKRAKLIAEEVEREEERKRQELLIADRKLQLSLFAEQARINQEAESKRLADEEASVKLARELEAEDQQRKKAVKPPKPSKKKDAGSDVADRVWDERDKKVYAKRMVGRSNPAPITKVSLRKPKADSQAQLQIFRGDQRQIINLDQVCKLHKEEWNEIRLAIGHSTSAAKEEVLAEIDRLFRKMVRLKLLRHDEIVYADVPGEERPVSPRYTTSHPESMYRVPNTRKLNLSLPAGVPKQDGFEVTDPEAGVVYIDDAGVYRFQRESELHKMDRDQLMIIILKVSCLPPDSRMKKAVTDEALERATRYLPSTEKFEIMQALQIIKKEQE